MHPRHLKLSMAFTSCYFNSLVFTFNLNKLIEICINFKFGKKNCVRAVEMSSV